MRSNGKKASSNAYRWQPYADVVVPRVQVGASGHETAGWYGLSG